MDSEGSDFSTPQSQINKIEIDTDYECDPNIMLINLVKSQSFIYDVADERHKDRNLIEQTWIEIACELGLTVDGE